MRVLVFDTETTGLPQTKIINPDTLHLWPHIVQFSYLIYDTTENEIIETNDYIIKIPEKIIISKESYNLHKITNEISSKMGTDMNIVLNNFFEDLKSVNKIIGHNIYFDINMLKVELLRIIYKKSFINEPNKIYKEYLHYITNYENICCTLKDSIELCNILATDKYGKSYLKYPKLIELHEKLFNVTPNNLHNSLNDILVTLRCYMKLKFNVDLMEDCSSFITVSNLVY
jgi:DNA polymerase III epsilon subunit-like protein